MTVKNTFLKKLFILLFVFVALSGTIHASVSNGTIDPSNYLAKFYDEGSDINFGYFTDPAAAASSVHVTDAELIGYLWGENVGWINLNCSNGNSCGSSNFRVSNDGAGNLSGYAWGENTGWINFKSTLPVPNPDHKVVIVSTGAAGFTSEFDGYAWSENYGWIQFDCGVVGACVKTDWQAQSFRPQCNNGIDDDSDGFTDYPSDAGCSSSTDTTEINNGIALPPVIPPVVPPITPIPPIIPVVPPTTPVTPTTPVQPPVGVYPPTTPIAPTTTPGTTTVSPPITPPVTIGGITVPPLLPVLMQKATKVINTPAGDRVAKVVTTVGVAVGAVASITAALFVNPLSFSELFLIPLRLWSLLLVAFGLKKRNRPWGTVYDSVTKQPIDPAYVVLRDASGKDVATSITDLDGRYAFLVKPGTYTMIANKTNYLFPSQKLAGSLSDEIYSDLYFGETITIETEETVIRKNIPMDAANFDWNEFAKKDRSLLKFYSQNDIAAARLARVLFVVGFSVAALALWAAPKPYNIAIFGLYVLLFVLRRVGLKPPPLGAVIEKDTGYPLSFALVRIYSASTNTEVGKRIADQRGRYHCLISKGSYYVTIEKKNTDQTYTKVLTSEPFETKSGIINKTFEV